MAYGMYYMWAIIALELGVTGAVGRVSWRVQPEDLGSVQAVNAVSTVEPDLPPLFSEVRR